MGVSVPQDSSIVKSWLTEPDFVLLSLAWYEESGTPSVYCGKQWRGEDKPQLSSPSGGSQAAKVKQEHAVFFFLHE